MSKNERQNHGYGEEFRYTFKHVIAPSRSAVNALPAQMYVPSACGCYSQKLHTPHPELLSLGRYGTSLELKDQGYRTGGPGAQWGETNLGALPSVLEGEAFESFRPFIRRPNCIAPTKSRLLRFRPARPSGAAKPARSSARAAPA